MQNSTTLFAWTPLKLAQYLAARATPRGGTPMLNDKLGEALYAAHDDAQSFGTWICTQPDTEHKGVAVVHVTFPQALRHELEASGDITRGGVNGHGSPVIKLSPSACARLNREARFFIEGYILKEDDDQPPFPRHLLN